MTAVRDRSESATIAPWRLAWVAGYRHRHPAADRWAAGTPAVTHSPQTQERVFRMAEQLARGGIDRRIAFGALVAADRAVRGPITPIAAAAAGHQAIRRLWPVDEGAVLICDGAGLEELRPFGFDPVLFDGRDPAAYAWVIFELSQRHAAQREADAAACDCHPSAGLTAIGVANDA